MMVLTQSREIAYKIPTFIGPLKLGPLKNSKGMRRRLDWRFGTPSKLQEGGGLKQNRDIRRGYREITKESI